MTSCEPIEFCDQTVTLTNENYLHNLCPQCQAGHTHFYNETTKLVEFDKCTASISKVLSNGVDLGANCLAATASECKFCKKGASLDSKGFCQNFKDNNCEGSFVEFLDNNFIGEIDGVSITNQAVYWAITKSNCDKCRSTFINLSHSIDFSKCFASVERENIVYPSSEDNDPSTAPQSRLLQSIANCASVDVLDTTACVTCNPGFSLDPTHKTCHQILNCSQQEFVLGKSVVLTRDPITNEQVLRCNECAAQFVPTGLVYPSITCEPSPFANCDLFNSDFTKCIQCMHGFYLKEKSEIYKIKTDNPVQNLIS